ncbi:MAG: hypothetical protein L0H55_11910 [Candidatus Nitrosocosmicus sp.]|nr:hypothetical protein [Candidatus Nitrosocosmicus sp.]
MEYLYVDEKYDSFIDFNRGISWFLTNSRPCGGFIAALMLEDIKIYFTIPGMGALHALVDNFLYRSVLNSIQIDLITSIRVPINGNNRTLAIYPTEIYLEKLSSIPNISKILVIPWN